MHLWHRLVTQNSRALEQEFQQKEDGRKDLRHRSRMDHFRETSKSPSFATMMAQNSGLDSSFRKTSMTQNSGLDSPFRNPSSNPTKGNSGRNKEVNHQNQYHPHHLHLQNDGPNLIRRDSGSSHTSSSKSKGKRANSSHKTSRPVGKLEATTKNKNKNLSPKKTPKKSKNPLKVLGIALIVDQKGTGERMLARYPTSQASVKTDDEDEEQPKNSNHHDMDDHEDDEDCNGDDRRRHRDDDLFFTLTARQMAKLFRTQRSLCNQPMTLRVNKTIFCCHAVLLEENSYDTAGEKDKQNNDPSESSDKKDENDDEDKEDNGLRLFSVVVALAPSTQQSALDVGSFGGGEDRSDLERYMRHGGTAKSNNNTKADMQTKGSEDTIGTKTNRTTNDHDDKSSRQKQKKKQTAARVSSAFLAIRRVHISLVRFCRALEREEHRCMYVTYQSRVLFQTRNERTKQLDQMRNRNSIQSSASPTTNSNSGSGNGDRSPYQERSSVGLVGGVHHHTPRHSRQNSFMSTPGGMSSLLSDSSLKKAFDNNELGGDTMGTVEQEQEKEQEILELMLACNPQDSPQGHQHPYQKRQHGNLVRDLVAVFHSLSRNDQEYPPTPNSLLCERDAVVYVNQHFAIPIDAAGLSGHSHSSSFAQGTPLSQQRKIGSVPITEGGLPVVRPYYTLLFPHASPSELLQTFHSSGSAPPQQMEHLLLTVNPQKPLTQVAADANLPMHTTMQIASFLIAHGACTTSPVVSSGSRLTCFGSDSMQRIPELALDFSQTFPGVSLFGVVSFLTTSSRHLGDAMAILANTENEEGAWLRESLLASPTYRHRNPSFDGEGSNDSATGDLSTSTHQALFQDEKNDPSSYSPTILPSYITTSRGGKPKSSGMPSEPTPMSVHKWLKDLEEALFSIAVWLLSHKVLVQLQEYMVVVADVSSPSLTGLNGNGENDSVSPMIAPPPFSAENSRVSSTGSSAAKTSSANDWDESLFKELLEMDYLNGDISIMALSWRMAIDPRKLRRWGLRHKRVRVISRIPSPGDDWEPETRTMAQSAVSPIELARSTSSAVAPTGTPKTTF